MKHGCTPRLNSSSRKKPGSCSFLPDNVTGKHYHKMQSLHRRTRMHFEYRKPTDVLNVHNNALSTKYGSVVNLYCYCFLFISTSESSHLKVVQRIKLQIHHQKQLFHLNIRFNLICHCHLASVNKYNLQKLIPVP